MTETCRALTALALLAILLAACSDSEPRFHAEADPRRLSDWGLFELDDALQPTPASLVLHPANQLFTDYAQKLRSLWIPSGTQIGLVDGEFDYPVGTVLSKTFYYPKTGSGALDARPPMAATAIALKDNRLLETRLMVRRKDGWDALPYVWNDTQTEAFLRPAGTSVQLSLTGLDAATTDFSYFVPNQNQCAACHVTEHPDGELEPLGAVSRQLTATVDTENPVLTAMIDRGWLQSTPGGYQTVRYDDPEASLDLRASEYLNINCGHCHNPQGAANTSALLLDGSHSSLTEMGRCKPPVAAGGGAGNLRYGIVPGKPEQSILIYRMHSSKADEMMPELGRSLVHKEGVQLISDWIASLEGGCP